MAVSSPEQYLADLNPAQREAVLATEGPVLVDAGVVAEVMDEVRLAGVQIMSIAADPAGG